MRRPPRSETKWTFAITAAALFMFALDRQVVATALPSIQRELGASLQALEWTVGAYTLSFCVLLLTGAALGDRFGRRRMFTAGVAVFTAASAGCAVAPSASLLIAARAVQGVGGAVITPLSLTILTAATPASRRGRVLGAWAATALGAASLGPVLGGALTSALSWHWIFWLNVPVGAAVIPLARCGLTESYGPRRPLDRGGIALSAAGLFALVWALIEAGRVGWSSAPILGALAAGALTLGSFVAWERRTPAPMLPMHFFSSRSFAAASVASLLAYFGLFGGFFLLAQLLQIGLSADPVRAGLELLALTCAAVTTAPVAGRLCDRVGPRPLLVGALALEALSLAWMAIVAVPGVGYIELAPAIALAGAASAGLFAPVQATLLGAVSAQEQGQASGAATVARELGGVLGVAVIGGVFAAHGSSVSPDAFLAGFRPALAIAAAAAAAGGLAALALPRSRPASARQELRPLTATD